MRPDLAFWLGLLRFQKFGPVRMGKLMDAFPSMREAFSASVAEMNAVGIEPNVAEAFCAIRGTIEPERELERVHAAGLSAVTRADDAYPAALKTLYDPPAVLFVRGTLPVPSRALLAVVGSRHATPYGIECVKRLVGPVARAGVGIVSGLAYGIDAAAHVAALEADGYTLAVLGGGVDEASLYPSQHRTLASRIVAAGGAVVSEYLPGTPSLKPHFPIRNRLIAGWSAATLIVEAAEKSGSLITARAALESGRDVFAVPGPIFSPLSYGPHSLIKTGALCADSSDAILQALGQTVNSAPKVAGQTSADVPPYESKDPDEAAVYAVLSAAPQHLDDIAETAGLAAHVAGAVLMRLELAGRAQDAGGLHYVRR